MYVTVHLTCFLNMMKATTNRLLLFLLSLGKDADVQFSGPFYLCGGTGRLADQCLSFFVAVHGLFRYF